MLELGRLDILTFSGGIGERGGAIRAAVCSGLEGMGIRLDAGQAEAAGEARISAPDSGAQVWVIPANEEWIVARAAAEVVSAASPVAP